MTSAVFSAIIFVVSERKMKNKMTLSEIRRHFELRRQRDAVRENLARIGKAAAIAVVRQRMPNIV